MTIRTITGAFVENYYRRCNDEDGAYDAHVGYIVRAVSADCADYTDHFIYSGRAGGEVPVVFSGRDGAERLVDRIYSAGCINLAYWWCYLSVSCNELPDYVLNPDRPEYN
jgi:hypothetical protein